MTRPIITILTTATFLGAAFLPPAAAQAQADLIKTGKVRLVEKFRTDDAGDMKRSEAASSREMGGV